MGKTTKKTSIGGQALIEGILMRGPDKMAIVCRTGDGIVIEHRPLKPPAKASWKRWPIIRGVVTLVDSMRLGIDALMFSADLVEIEEPEKETFFEKNAPNWLKKWYEKNEQAIEQWGSIAFSLVAAIGLFFFLPTLLTSLFAKVITNSIALNLVEGLIRIGIFLAYVILISRMPEVKRVFGYHGAEHKTIHCYEHGEELTVVNVKKYPIEHPRCGTSFLFNVMLISILVLSVFGWPNPWVRMAVRLLTLPLIAGIAYEVNRFVGRSDGKLAELISAPGLWLQGTATVREPEDDQIEVAIVALQEVIPDDADADRW